MPFEPTGAQRLVAETARAVARDVVAPAAREADRSERFPAATVGTLAEAGLLALNVPRELGGAGAGAVAYVLAMMEIAAADAAVAVTMGVTNMVGEVVARHGTPEQQRRCCHRLASGEWLAGSFALSEPGTGSDPAAMATRAERRLDRWVLSGEKQWITSGDVAGVMVVWAKTDPGRGARGITAFLVEAGTPGLRVGRHEAKMGQRASSTVSLSFEECAVPGSAVLGQVGHGFSIAMDALDGGRCGIAAQATGTIRAALDASLARARQRRAFGWPIAEFQAVRWSLADMKTEHEAARLLTLRAAGQKEAGQPFTREASMAKLFASEAAQRAVSKAVQIHGGDGCLEAFPAEKLFRDARAQTIYEGTSEIQRLVIARELLG